MINTIWFSLLTVWFKFPKKFVGIIAFTCSIYSFDCLAVDAQLFRPHVHTAGTYSLFGSAPMPIKQFNYGLTYTYTKNPISFGLNGAAKIDDLVNSLHTLNLGISYQYSERWNVLADAPIHYVAEYEPASSSLSKSSWTLGDILVSGHYTLRNEKQHWYGMSLLPFASLPTGSVEGLVGEGTQKIGVKVIIDKHLNEFNYFVTNIGVVNRKSEEVFGLQLGNIFEIGVGYIRPLNEDHLLELVTEVNYQGPLGGATPSVDNSPAEVIVGVRNYLGSGNGRWDLGAGRGMNIGYGAPEARLFFNFTWGPSKPKYQPPEIKEAEAPKPEEPPVVKLQEPIKIKVGKIYFDIGKATIKKESHVVLEDLIDILHKYSVIHKVIIIGHTDSMGDREKNIRLSQDRAQSVYNYLVKGGIRPELLNWEGRGPDFPIVTNDTRAGREENRRVEFNIVEVKGQLRIEKTNKKFEVPPSAKELVTVGPPVEALEEIKVGRIDFETGMNIIKKASLVVVNKLKKFLQSHPEIIRIRIEGYTDNRGTREVNLELSESRAKVVGKKLIQLGVDPGRIEWKGFGPDNPIADNNKRKGRATNRRVEVKVLKKNPDLAIPKDMEKAEFPNSEE